MRCMFYLSDTGIQAAEMVQSKKLSVRSFIDGNQVRFINDSINLVGTSSQDLPGDGCCINGQQDFERYEKR